MKLFPLIILLIAQTPAFSQFYISAGGGYALGFPKQNIESICNEQKYSNTNRSSDVTENKYFSFGKGYHSTLAVGYNITQSIAVELRTSALLSAKVQTTLDENYTTPFTSQTNNWVSHTDITYAAKFYYATPSLTVKKCFEKFVLGIRLGLVAGLGQIEYNAERTYAYQSSSGTGNEVAVFQGGFTVGFSSALTANYKIADRWDIFGEIEFINLSYAPVYFTIKADGVTYNIAFLDKFANDKINDILVQRVSYPFSSIGLNIGVKYSFGKKKKEEGK